MIKAGKGVLAVLRRPVQPTPAWHFLPCSFCYGFVLRNKLSAHVAQCRINVQGSTGPHKACGVALLASCIPADTRELDIIIAAMKCTLANPGVC